MSETDSSTPDARMAVLLVEDTLEEALLVRTILENELGCKVTLAQDGIRGCQLAENQAWDLVITDLNIPGRDGMEVIRTSTESHPETPVLATTAYTGSHYLDQALRSGADDVLTKPLDPEQLLEEVRALTADRRATKTEPDADAEAGEPPERTILALGALPGDVELGCGGILLGHRAHGHAVSILVMSAGGDEDGAEERRAEARKAADLLDVDLTLGDPFRGKIPSVEKMIAWTREVVTRVEPDTLYAPSHHDVRDSRLGAHQAAVVEGSEIPNHYAYQAATTTLDFHPSLFIDVDEYMDRKLRILEEFGGESDFRPHLQPHIARASAQYWGRFIGYGEAEPLEVVRSER